MTMTLSGDGSITGLVAGGLPDATITQADLATGVAGTGPAFSVRRSANQTGIASNTNTKIAFNTEDFDTANCFDPTTNYRFTPNVAGYYQITVSAYMAGTNVQYLNASIWKNGAIYAGGTDMSNGVGEVTSYSTALIYMNGTTDYVEAYAFGLGSTVTVYVSATTRFSGFLARAA